VRSSNPRVQLSELLLAYEFASSDAPFDHYAVIDPDTGAVYCWSSDSKVEDELPADIETSERYVDVPDKRSLDLGRNLVLSFADQEIPAEYEIIVGFFRSRGAYGRFKGFLESRNLLQRWYDFEANETEKALRLWCQENGIDIVDEPSVA
jgi:hypothetical protein